MAAPVPVVPFPALGARVPRRGGALRRAVGRAALTLAGWSFEGGLPDRPKFVIAVAPHTSNWDFIVGVFARQALGLRARFLGKDALFKPPLGPLMRWLGGTPVRRDVSAGMVQQVTAAIRAEEQFVLAVAPEGTRRRVAQWRTGFYHIAREAEIPIALVTFDYGRKRIVADQPLLPSGDVDGDLERMRAFVQNTTPKKIDGV